MTVTFFGHRTIVGAVEQKLKRVIIKLIEENSADNFYIGNNGEFDKAAKNVLKEAKIKYPHIKYAVVLAYVPSKKSGTEEEADTIVPEDIESVLPKYAICARNKWMLLHSDTVVTYVVAKTGGAARFKSVAEKMGKNMVDICTQTESAD